ncbi:MAG: MGMT family protein [Thermaerobacter sp.]|nr:MGMT family protein [Thermaerobacter sp.]
MEHYVIHAGPPFGEVSFWLEQGNIVEVSLGEAEGAQDAPKAWSKALREHLMGRRRFPVELDFSGISPFRSAAMRAAMEIPPGEVATYGEIAERIGHPGAARAVGSAMARNPFVLLVPCHRVVPKAGGLGQYGAGDGQATKAALLEWERTGT